MLGRSDIKQIVNVLPGRLNAIQATQMNGDPNAMKKMIVILLITYLQAQKRELRKF